MTTHKRMLIIITTLLILGIIGWHYYSKNKAGAGGFGGMPPSSVTVVNAKLQNWQHHLQATGTLSAEQGVLLKAETAGRITKIYVESGQKVKEGDPLFEINPGILQAQLASAEAQVVLNSGNYDRAIKLAKRGDLSQQDLDTALANKNAAIANADAIKAQLTENIIRAPFNGTLGIRLFNLGDYINQGQSLINLQSLDPLRVDFVVPEQYANQVHVGDKLTIHSIAFPNTSFSGEVTAVDSAIDLSTRTLAVRARVPNPEQKLLPGNFVQVSLSVGIPQPMITIPQIAVVYEADANYVYIVKNNIAVKTRITLAEQNDNDIAIKSGLKPGDVVVNTGQLKIMDGGPVMVVPNNVK